MKNLNRIIDKIEKKINEKEKTREKALHFSREIIIKCRKIIQKIHQNSLKDTRGLLEEATSKLVELCNLTKNYPDLFHAGFVENASQELVEAQCLYNIKKGEPIPDPDKIPTTYSAYLLGLCDLVGELRRVVLDYVRKGESKKADRYLEMMEDIYDMIIRFDYPSGLIPIKKKQDIVRALIEKTRGELAVASCEKRIEYHTDEFRGILDTIYQNNDKKKKNKNKKEDEELDIDRIW